MILRLNKLRDKYGGNVDVRQLQLLTCLGMDGDYVSVAERVVPINKIKYRKSKKYVYLDMI
jgi:hypothetical protein